LKSLVKMFAVALAASTIIAVPAFAKSDDEDLTTAISLCRAEITKQTGTPDENLNNSTFKLKAKALTLKVFMKTEAGSKTVTCVLDRKAQTVSLVLPEGVTPAVATAASQ
jgi:hypothetical protein